MTAFDPNYKLLDEMYQDSGSTSRLTLRKPFGKGIGNESIVIYQTDKEEFVC